TVHEDADYARAALDAGGLGYVVKSRLASDLLPAIQAALANQSFVSPAVRIDEPQSTSSDLPAKPNIHTENHEADPPFVENAQCDRAARGARGLRQHTEHGKHARCRGL